MNLFNKKMKLFYFKFLLKYFSRFTSPYLINKILQKEGVTIGDHTIIYDPQSQTIDRERPWMLKIGDYCKITKGCTILTHDYSRSVIRMVDGQVIGEAGMTVIGNNVFVGMHSTILMGTHIGDNVIVGAGSVVSGIVPSNVVIAGNPARIIRTLSEHIAIRKRKMKQEAFLYYNTFCKHYGRKPTIQEMGPFFPLFLRRTKEDIIKSHVNVTPNGDDSIELMKHFMDSAPLYLSYEEFQRDAELNNN